MDLSMSREVLWMVIGGAVLVALCKVLGRGKDHE